MYATLVVVDGKADRRRLNVKLPAVLGRSSQADLTIAHLLISREHCELRENNGVVVLTDLGSLNGTFCRDHRIQRVPLLPNDRFSVGPLTFEIHYDYDGGEGDDFQTDAATEAEVTDVELPDPIDSPPVELSDPVEVPGKRDYVAVTASQRVRTRRSERLAGFTHREADAEQAPSSGREAKETIKIDALHPSNHSPAISSDAPTSQSSALEDGQKSSSMDVPNDSTEDGD